jgi:hypothetical protein
MIDQDSPVRVVRIRSGQLVVRPVESPAMAARPSGGEAPAGLELDLDFDVENPQTI